MQLSSPTPPDSRLLRNGSKDAVGTPFHAGNGCTLVLACRNQKKAQEAKEHLLTFLDRIRHADEAVLESGETPSRWPDAQDLIPADRDPVASGIASPDDEVAIRHRKRFVEARSASIEERDGYARLKYRAGFCAGTAIDIVPLDLGSLESTQACIRTLKNKYVRVCDPCADQQVPVSDASDPQRRRSALHRDQLAPGDMVDPDEPAQGRHPPDLQAAACRRPQRGRLRLGVAAERWRPLPPVQGAAAAAAQLAVQRALAHHLDRLARSRHPRLPP